MNFFKKITLYQALFLLLLPCLPVVIMIAVNAIDILNLLDIFNENNKVIEPVRFWFVTWFLLLTIFITDRLMVKQFREETLWIWAIQVLSLPLFFYIWGYLIYG